MKFDIRAISSRFRGLFNKTPGQTQKPVVNYERDFHKLTFSELCQKFSTSVTNGLDDGQAKAFLTTYGKNKITQKTKNPVIKIIGYFFTGFCPLIFIAAIVCILGK